MNIPIGYAQVTHFYGGSALPFGAANTYGIDLASSFSGLDLAAFLHDEWSSVWPANADSNASLVSTRVKEGPTVSGPTFDYADEVSGSLSGVGNPPNTCLLVQKTTALGGRSGRGRMYLPAPGVVAGTEQGSVNPTTVTDLNARLSTFQDNLAAEDIFVYLLHTESSDPTLVTGLTTSPKLATQRRRMRR